MSILFLLALVGIAGLVAGIMTAIDASKYPEWAFQRAGTTKFVWQILPILFLFVCGVGSLVMGGIWFTSKRDEVAFAAQSAGPPPYYGAPPPYPPPAAPGWAPPPPPSVPPPYPPPVPPSEPPQ